MELYIVLGMIGLVILTAVPLGPIAVANGIASLLEKIAFLSGWLLVVLAFVTCFDVISRRFGLPTFDLLTLVLGVKVTLTSFQELEWWLHTAIFSTWMGYNYTINAHPRVDSYTEDLGFKTRAWIELAGCLIFALPYIAITCYYGLDFLYQSWKVDEGSESAVGLPNRWIIKGVYVAGIFFVMLAILSVMLKLVAYLFGRVPQERANLQIGKAELEV